jgi:trigger factor
LRIVEEDRPIQEGDVAMVDFTPWVDGVVFERGKTNDFMAEIGKNTLHPDFDGNLVGRRAGESFSFELDYPNDAPTSEIAGKRVKFDVTIKEIKEKDLPELNDEFAKEAGQFDTLEALRQSTRERLEKREQDRISMEVQQKIADLLLEKIDIRLSQKVIDREVDRMIEMLTRQFESQGLKIDTSKFNTPEIRADYQPKAEKNLLKSLILEQIAQKENIELTEDELEEIYRQVAMFARMAPQKVKQEYADSPVVAQAKESKIQEKVLKLLEENAVLTEVSDEGKDTDQE